MFQDYGNQFNKRPVSELEAYCKEEGVSLLFVGKPKKSRNSKKRLQDSRMVLGNLIIRFKEYIITVRGKGTVS